MIRYECMRCGAVLDTSDDTAGGSERCPACGFVQAVPGSRTARAEQHTDPSGDMALLAEAAESSKALHRTLDRAQHVIDPQVVAPAASLPHGKKRCTECRELIHQRASKCPYCQSRQYEVAPAVVAISVLAVLVIAVFGVVLALHSSEPSGEAEETRRKAMTPQARAEEDQRVAEENREFDDDRAGRVRTKKPSIEYMLATINSGYVPEDDITVTRFRYLLQALENKSLNTKQQIADMSVSAVTALKDKYGKDVKLLDFMEGMNTWLPAGERADYAVSTALYMQVLK